MSRRSKNSRQRLWLVSDQKESYQVYVAFFRHLVGTQVQVRHRFADQGTLLLRPDKTVQSLIRGPCRATDYFVLLADTEDHQPDGIKRSRRALERVRRALAKHGVERSRVHIVLVPPCTEAVYLLHDDLLAVVVRELGAAFSVQDHRRLRGLATGRRQQRVPPKADLDRLFRFKVPRRKRVLAESAAAVVTSWDSLPSICSELACLRSCLDWAGARG
jgi:hypothetical protein